MTTIAGAFRYLRSSLRLPPGFEMKVDHFTGNILIYECDYGFCITELYCRTHSHEEILDQAIKSIASLNELTFKQPTAKLLRQASAETRFDS